MAGKTGARRAIHACTKCRTRKVRCDVSIRGRPCMNCSLDGENCEVTLSKRATRRNARERLEAPTRSIRPSVGPENGADDGSTGLLGGSPVGCIDTPNSLKYSGITVDDRKEQISPVTADSLKSLQAKDQKEEQEKEAAEDPSPDAVSPNYIGHSYYQFLTVNNVSAMPAQDYRFLELQGCLQVPIRRILNVFVREYFLHMHPMLPILDEGAFWDIYNQRPESKSNGQISLLLFQSMLFASCNFVSPDFLRQIGQTTTRGARATFYRRAKLLFDLEAESSSIVKAQAALLLASWSFSSYEIPRKPTVPWLLIAVQNARDADAHNYESFIIHSEDYAVRKRLWWGCIIRDRLFGLGMRRGIQISPAQFDVTGSSRLGHSDLAEEVHRSAVYPFTAKVRLAEILERLVALCIVLTDVLDLAFPIEASMKQAARDGPDLQCRARNCQIALCKWYEQTVERLPSPVTLAEQAHHHHDSVVLYVNLIYMYYYLAKITLGHYQVAVFPANCANTSILQHNHFELQDAVLGTTRCLEQLAYLQLVKWLPVTAVSCTALPLLLHVLGTEISPSTHMQDSNHTKLMQYRLRILQKAMETYQIQYEGVCWISMAIDHAATLFRASHPAPQVPTGQGRGRKDHMLVFQPGWYLRLAFAVDMALGKGRLLEGDTLAGRFHEQILPGMSPRSEDDFKEMPNEDDVNEEDTRAAKRRKNEHSASPGQAQVASEPYYVITDARDPFEVCLMDKMDKVDGSHSCKSPFADIIGEEDDEDHEHRVSEKEILALFGSEALDGNADFSVGFTVPV
ncbi:fungal-specific transcription factor domain-containing protein [Aspergillus unguis]